MRLVPSWACSLLAAACSVPNPEYRSTIIDAGRDAGGAIHEAAADRSSPPEPEWDGPAPSETPGVEPPADPPTQADAGAELQPDGPAVPPPDAPQDAFVLPAGCGTLVAEVSGIARAEGVAVDPVDGMFYYLIHDNDHSYAGRLTPAGARDDDWLRVDWSPTPAGLVLDSARARVWVLVVDAGGGLTEYRDIRTAPIGRTVLRRMIPDGNDLAVAADGSLYYSQQSDGHLYRVALGESQSTRVTRTAIGDAAADQGPAALAFASDGSLLVGQARGGPIHRLTLVAGVESSRSTVGAWRGWANGMTFDRRGRLYVSQYHDTVAQPVVRLDQQGNATPVGISGRFSSIAFGQGVLDCRDLYIANPAGPMQRLRIEDAL